jgi:radical SAM superfamily enzyme YgiQ (UPF0313 family)
MEALQDGKLANLEKRQSVADIERAIEAVHAHDMRVIGLFMIGFDEDDERSAGAMVDFCEARAVDSMSIYCLTEYPSLPGRTLPRYRICETDLDYYNGHFVTTFPMRMPPSVLERSVFDALSRYYNPRKIVDAIADLDPREALMQLAHYLQFRRMADVSTKHQRKLEAIERPYYGPGGRLREEALRARPLVTAPLPPDVLADWRDPEAEAATPIALQ